jgi:hypothetical protein
MAEKNLVEHLPMIPSTASITDISTGRVFGGSDATSLLAKLNPMSETDTYHWSSALDGKPGWAILDNESEILHIRAHDCPHPATPLNPTCYDCITGKLEDKTDFVFMWKTTRATQLSSRQTSSEPTTRPSSVDYVIREAGTPLCDLFDTPWTDVFGTAQYQLGQGSNLLLQHCGACPNPMDGRLQQCATCVESRAPDGFPDADYLMFVKMLRPADGLERQNSFPGLHEARAGQAEAPRFGSSSGSNNPDDTGDTQVFTG